MKKASRADIIAIHNRLESCLEKLGEGTVQYKDGLSDQKLADELNVPWRSVMGVRTELFGHLLRREPSAGPDATTLATLVHRFNMLIDGLAVARALDARHLKMPESAEGKKD